MRAVPFALLIPLVLAYFALVATLATGSRSRRALSLLLALAGLVAPWLAPATPPTMRAFVALGAALSALRTIDLVRMKPRQWSAPRRVLHVLGIVDSRYLTRATPRCDWRTFIIAALYALGTAIALIIVIRVAPTLGAIDGWIVRWLGGVAMLYCLLDGMFLLVRGFYRLAGFVVPDLHRHPILSRSVQEFWGERWNRPVSLWLREHCLKPLARRRKIRAGVALAFVVSAALHAYLALPELGLVATAASGVFFLVQGLVVIIETRLGVRRWPAAAGHIWSIASVLIWSPLLIEPVLRILVPGLGVSAAMQRVGW